MKNRLFAVRNVLLVFITVFVCSIFCQSEASAYFATSKDGKTQCFALQYTLYEKHNNPVTGTTASITNTKKYSTVQVCAHIDASGKVTGSLTKKDAPDGTKLMSHPKITIGSAYVHLYTCPANSTWCGSAKEKEQSFEVSSFNTFKELAQAVIDAAPATYANNDDAKKATLEDNKTTKDLQEEAKKEDKQTETDAVNDKPANSLDRCKSGGAKALGWIVCPIIEWAGDAAQDVYNSYVEPSLNIEPQLFDSSKNGGALQQAWGTFRDIANIIFVILLLAVIFSQLTGVGIDNYGIKRILPKLIVAAVLINLSYFLCVLAVDVSNILGNSFQALFDGLGMDLSTTLVIPDGQVEQEIESTAGSIAGLSILGALAGMTGAIWATPAVVMSLLVGSISVVVAIFFLFILLAARESAIIVLIVIAPVAVVLYALPNTKKIFDKWLSLFKGLLLVYPIAGLLVGGGDYVSALLLAVGGGKDFFSALTAMVVGVLPIFFIPTVLKSAFSAMGNLGARIAGFGQRIGSGATRAARSSSMYQGLQDRAGKFAVKQRAEMGKKYALGDSRYARFRRGMLGGTRGIAADLAMSKKAEADEVDNYMTFINDRTRNGEDEAKVNEIFDQYMKEKNKAGAVAAARVAGRRKDTAARFASSKLTRKGATSDYDQSMLQSIAKEVATGENSGNYRASAPLAFEFASQINKSGVDENGNLNAEIDYENWANNNSNIKEALDHHVTNSSELVGMKNSSLGELATMMEDGKVDETTMARMQKLASETIANRGKTGVWDSTKEENIYRIAGMSVPSSGGNTGGTNVVRDANGRVIGTQTNGGIWMS